MTVSLDSSFLVEVLNNRKPAARQNLAAHLGAGQPAYVSTVVVHELRFGAAFSARAPERQAQLDLLLPRLSVIDLDEADAFEAALIRNALERQGIRIGALDILIAGQARQRGLSVVTCDTRHFSRIDGLVLTDWTTEP